MDDDFVRNLQGARVAVCGAFGAINHKQLGQWEMQKACQFLYLLPATSMQHVVKP